MAIEIREETVFGSAMIRDATRDDVPLLAQLIRQSFRDVAEHFSLTPENCPNHPSFITEPSVREGFDKGGQFFVLEEGGQPCGCVGLVPDRAGSYSLVRLAVSPEHRRRGLGAMLVRRVLDEAKHLKLPKVELGIIAAQTCLQRLYEKHGFRMVETRRFAHLPFEVTLMVADLPGGILPASMERVEGFWSSRFGCSPEALHQPTVCVMPRSIPDSAWAMRWSLSCILSVPPSLVDSVRMQVQGRNPEQVYDAEFLSRLMDAALDRLIGPCFIGYADASCFRPRPHCRCRVLRPFDGAALAQLASACGPTEWDHGGIDLDLRHEPVFGYCEDGAVLAAASYEVWGGCLGHVGVVTHPKRRGEGLGTLVASMATADVLSRRLVAQWRTLDANEPSKAIGGKLGYVELGSHYAMRLTKQDSRP